MLRVGLVGAGYMGRTHADIYKNLATQQPVSLVGVTDKEISRADKIAHMHQAEVYDSAEALIDDPTIDVIDICLPTYLHARYAKRAMQAGKAVFIETPATLTPEEGQRLLEVQEETGAFVMVGQCVRLWDSYRYLKEQYEKGTYGKLQSLVLRRLSRKPGWGWQDWYLDTEKSGGAVLDMHIHDVDFMLHLLGEPTRLVSAGDRNHMYTLCDYPNDVTVMLEGSWKHPASFPFTMSYMANFEQATLHYSRDELSVYLQEDDRLFVVDLTEDRDYTLPGITFDKDAYYDELYYFIDCILTGKENTLAPLSEAVQAVHTVYREIEAGNLR